MNITKTIHHIAPKDISLWHPLWNKCYYSWFNHFSDFEHRLWNDQSDIDEVVRKYQPEYFEFYNDLPIHIMKIDFARFVILYEFGGIYTDMDVFCYSNFFETLNLNSVYLMPAPYGDTSTNGEHKIENCLLISPPKHPFFRKCMENSKNIFYTRTKNKNIKFPLSAFNMILVGTTTGPVLVSNTLSEFESGVEILNSKLFNNHGLSYDKLFYTKHLLTGVWGREANDPNKNNAYLKSVSKYGNLQGVTLDNFDFYTDYTDGNYLK